MSQEAELLRAIDSIVVELLARRDCGPEEDFSPVSGLATEAAGRARELRLDRTEAQAAAIATLARQQPGSFGQSLENLYLALEHSVNELQLTAETEIERRLTGADALGTAVAEEAGAAAGMLPDFVNEAREHLEIIELQLLALEESPREREPVHAIFRGFHTIKGLAGICGLEAARELAHEVETLLDSVRGGQLAVTPDLIELALESSDYLRGLVDAVEQSLPEGTLSLPRRPAALLNRLQAFASGPEAGPGAAAPPAADPAEPNPEPAEPSPDSAGSRQHGAASVKVDTAKLDQLVDMVGELVISQTLVRLDPALQAVAEPRLARNVAQLARITSELQKTAMSLRVVPIGPAFQRMARLVRDLTLKCGKQARLEMEGEDAELDRTIVERLMDPLMHMIRNAVDHGLETVEERIAAGKPPAGRLLLKAFHQSGHIVIEVSDDGRGINHRKILNRAISRGLVAPDSQLTTAEILDLIFLPGFSTAEAVTDISGRGVGMDVVRKQIHALRGRVEIRSVEGQGTTFLLRLPLTLAIIEGLVVRVGAERYILPLYAVHEIFRPDQGSLSTIEGRHEVALVRDSVVPVLRLARLLKRRNSESHDTALPVLIMVELQSKRYGLVVDEVCGKQEVVIKSLGAWLGHVPGLSGGAILGDGSVGIIVDLESLIGAEVHAATH